MTVSEKNPTEKQASETAGLEAQKRPDWESFGREIMQAWPHCGFDCCDLQDTAEKHRVILEVPGGYNPEKHGEDDYGAEPGDRYFLRNYDCSIAAHSDSVAEEMARKATVFMEAIARKAAEKLRPFVRRDDDGNYFAPRDEHLDQLIDFVLSVPTPHDPLAEEMAEALDACINGTLGGQPGYVNTLALQCAERALAAFRERGK